VPGTLIGSYNRLCDRQDLGLRVFDLVSACGLTMKYATRDVTKIYGAKCKENKKGHRPKSVTYVLTVHIESFYVSLGFFLTKVLTKWPQNQKGLQTEICNPLIILVRLAGIEPTTPWFVAKYSIQLSYSREKQHYSMALSGNGSSISRRQRDFNSTIEVYYLKSTNVVHFCGIVANFCRSAPGESAFLMLHTHCLTNYL
jgi:hypothetical protein